MLYVNKYIEHFEMHTSVGCMLFSVTFSVGVSFHINFHSWPVSHSENWGTH